MKTLLRGTMEKINPLDHTGLIHKALQDLRYLYDSSKSMEYDDCYQIGFIALMEALEGYDSSKGAISSYIIPRIKWSVQRECRASYEAIRKPEHLHEKYRKIKKAANHLEQLQDKPPTPQQLANIADITRDELESLLMAFAPVGALQHPLSGQDDITLQDTIEDTRDYFGEIDLRIFREQLRRDLDQLMKDRLTPDEQLAIKAFYGWDSGQQMTQEAIGNLMDLTTSQSRGLIERALRALRKQIYYLARRHPEIVTHQVYNGIGSDGGNYKKEMAQTLFKVHACIGDQILINEQLMTITEHHHEKVIGTMGGSQRSIFYFTIYDIELRSGKVRKIFIH